MENSEIGNPGQEPIRVSNKTFWENSEDPYLIKAQQLLDECVAGSYFHGEVAIFAAYLRFKEVLSYFADRIKCE